VRSGVRVEAGADPRVELVGALQSLARGAPPPTALESLAARLRGQRRHPAVAACARLGDGDALGLVVQLLSADARLEWRRPREMLSPDFAAACGGFDGLEKLLELVRDFARRSRFFALCADAAADYAPAVRAARAGLRTGARQALLLERYLGERLPAHLRFVLCGLYRSGRYNAYILPYPYPRPGESAPPRGPYDVVTLLPLFAEEEFEFDSPLQTGLLQELVYCWAEPFVWAYRRELLGDAPPPDLQYRTTRVLVDLLSIRAAERAGLRSAVARPKGPLADRVRAALGRYERGGARSLAQFAPALARAMTPARGA